MMSELHVQSRSVWWKRQDWLLTAAVVTLTGFGALLVWSATRSELIAAGRNPQTELIKHVVTIIIGTVLAVGVVRSRYLLLRAYAPVLYLLGVAGLVFVLYQGIEIDGIKAWIPLPGGFTLQPSEFAKLAIVLGVSIVLAETAQRGGAPTTKQVLLSLLIVGVPAVLILLEPDLGTTLVVGVIYLGLLSVSGSAARWSLGLGGIAVVGVVVALSTPLLLEGWQRQRLLIFMDPNSDLRNWGYQLSQVRIAIGGGGLLGTGFLNGPQTNGAFVPVQQTDFIFSAAAEQFGFVGGAFIIALLFLIVWRALRIALLSSDRFGRIAATGIATWIAFQSFENIGMNIGIMPMTGVPLPFVSSGGSSMFALWMAFGLLQNISIRASE